MTFFWIKIERSITKFVFEWLKSRRYIVLEFSNCITSNSADVIFDRETNGLLCWTFLTKKLNLTHISFPPSILSSCSGVFPYSQRVIADDILPSSSS